VRRFVFKPRWILGHLLVLAAAYTCLRLGGWQLGRAHVTESAQNWGYAFQWPLFAVCFLIGWWRMLRLESIRLDEQQADQGDVAASTVDTPVLTSPAFDPPAGSAPAGSELEPVLSREDAEHAAYNRMLAALAAQDAARDRR
jgi:DNA-binding transcriptional regulator of glucitol operon